MRDVFRYATEVALVARPFAFATICCSTFVQTTTFLLFITVS